ncbi:MAG TPA: hypothetical protein P5539_05775 [Mesotoga sp.]|nr:hypothetical protein [Mesotoga sp.]
MTKTEQALEVLLRAQDQLINEIATAGEAGGVGRAQNFAPVLVNISNAADIVRALLNPVKDDDVVDRMAAMRAAKAAKQGQQQRV